MQLVCSRGFGGELFRALFAEVDLDAAGGYQDHRLVQPGYICLNCGAPAFDLAVVPAEMAAEAEEDAVTSVVVTDILCPVCEPRVQVGDERDCANCGAPPDIAEPAALADAQTGCPDRSARPVCNFIDGAGPQHWPYAAGPP